ncbi:MAG: formate dehydrogenase accessory protein FdhE [Desulfomonilaceae bacterium]
MVSNETQQQIAREIKDSLDKFKEGIPQLTAVLDAFQRLLVARSIARMEIPAPDLSAVEIDPVRLSSGSPILNDRKIDVDRNSVKKVGRLILPAIRKGFPKLDKPLERLINFMDNDDTAMDTLHLILESGSSGTMQDLAAKLDISRPVLEFICSELAKPFAEKFAESLTPRMAGLVWLKGYCPICGSWPSLSLLREKEGKRNLICSVCSYEYGYMRTQCPFCENGDHTKLEIIFSEDRKFERAELCHVCNKYIVGIDTRDLINTPHPSTAPLGLIYLDFLAQDRGFSPGATLAIARDLTM